MKFDQVKEYVVEWVLPKGELRQGAGIYSSIEEAEADVRIIIRTCQHWSLNYRFVEKGQE